MQKLGLDMTESKHSENWLNDRISSLKLESCPSISLSEVLIGLSHHLSSWLQVLLLDIVQLADFLD